MREIETPLQDFAVTMQWGLMRKGGGGGGDSRDTMVLRKCQALFNTNRQQVRRRPCRTKGFVS